MNFKAPICKNYHKERFVCLHKVPSTTLHCLTEEWKLDPIHPPSPMASSPPPFSCFLCLLWLSMISLAIVSTNATPPRKPIDVPFNKNYVPTWAYDHIRYFNGGKEIQLVLDKSTGILQNTKKNTLERECNYFYLFCFLWTVLLPC